MKAIMARASLVLLLLGASSASAQGGDQAAEACSKARAVMPTGMTVPGCDGSAPPALPSGAQTPAIPAAPPRSSGAGIQSVGGGGQQSTFRQMSGASEMRRRMQQAPKPAPAPKPGANSLSDGARHSGPAGPARQAKPAPAVPKARREPVPARPALAAPETPAAPVAVKPSRNPVLKDFSLAVSLLKGIDSAEARRSVRDVAAAPLATLRLALPTAGGLAEGAQPVLGFPMVALDHDPLNLGLPRVSAVAPEPGLWERLFSRGAASAGAQDEAGRYLAFGAPPPGELGVAAKNPMLLTWSPGRALPALLLGKTVAPAAAGGAFSGLLAGEEAAFEARRWGL